MHLSRMIPCLLLAGLVCLAGQRLQQDAGIATAQSVPAASVAQIFGAH